jgi:hypothetical protein
MGLVLPMGGIWMEASGVAIGVMRAVVLICPAFWLTAIMLAARRPGFAHVRPEKMHGHWHQLRTMRLLWITLA